MAKATTRPRAKSASTQQDNGADARPETAGDALPDADLSEKHLDMLKECLPASFLAAVGKASCDARAVGWLTLELLELWTNGKKTLEDLLWRETDRVSNGGDLLTELADHIGLGVVEEVLVGLHYAIGAQIDYSDPQESPGAIHKLRCHAADHIMEVGEPSVLAPSRPGRPRSTPSSARQRQGR